MQLEYQLNERYQLLNPYAKKVLEQSGATGGALMVIERGKIVHEWYAGIHQANTLRKVSASSQFNVSSVRKTYLAMAIGILIEQGKLKGVKDKISQYFPEFPAGVLAGVQLRHLLTHTHGLTLKIGQLEQVCEPGTSWRYNKAGIALLTQLVEKLSGKSVAEFLTSEVFVPMGLSETGWRIKSTEDLVQPAIYASDRGDRSNLFVSTRELAFWGYLHLTKGEIGQQVLPSALFTRLTEEIVLKKLPNKYPRYSFLWWMQSDFPQNIIGEKVPAGSYQIAGVSGCTCLVIPAYDVVAVRMFNQSGNVDKYDYLADTRHYGNLVAGCAAKDGLGVSTKRDRI
ncbi:MAG: serine hydrolase domain-containing protein [Bacteroidota bacterium]